MKPFIIVPKILSSAFFSLFLLSCNGGSSDSTVKVATSTIKTGILIDSVVEGVAYKTHSQSGYTNSLGEFKYLEGERVTFTLGGFSLGSSLAKPLISPYTLHPTDENRAIKLARLLQTIDEDSNSSNGIRIKNHTTFSSFDSLEDFNASSFETSLSSIFQFDFNKTLISVNDAQTHLNATLNTKSLGDVNSTAQGNNSFNTYDASTFASSTCNNLPVIVPQGIFVSVDGSSSAEGTQNNPLDLATALSSLSPVEDGETIWIEEGVYEGSFTSQLQGSSLAPIKVKPYPGQRVVIDNTSGDSSGLTINGEWTEYYGLEVLSRPTKRESQERGSNPSDLKTTGGVSVYYGKNTKVINFIVHDNLGGGFSSWSPANDSELYGNIIYNNGWSAPDRGHGHAIYAQNKIGYKKLTNNIIFFGFGTGIHVYTEGGQIDGFDVQDNVWFMTGASDPRESQRKDNCLIGGFQPVKNLTLKNNLGYSHNSRGTRIGYGGNVVGQDATVWGNYLSENFWVAGNWSRLDVSNTTVHRGTTGSSFSQVNDLGGNSFLSEVPDSGKKIVVSANKYDKRRARVVVYNYDEDNNVSVDLSSVLKVGEAYRIHSSFGLFNYPLISGIYDGSNISIPINLIEPPQPRGLEGIEDSDNPHKKFSVFIVTHGGCE